MILNNRYNIVVYNSDDTFIVVKPRRYNNSNLIFDNLNNFANNCTLLTNSITINKINYDFTRNMTNAFANCSNLIDSPVCGNSVTSMGYTYAYCSNLNGSPVCGNNVINMSRAYLNCFNLTGSPVCGENVTNMGASYGYCSNLNGSPVCGNKVTQMSQTYYGCNNLTNSPVCGNNVVNMDSAYDGCSNLNGSPVCGNKVTSMKWAYTDCSNLTGSPVCGDNVTTMYRAYERCSKLTGTAVCGNNVVNMDSAYAWCNNITGMASNNNLSTVTTMRYTYYECRKIPYGASINWFFNNTTNNSYELVNASGMLSHINNNNRVYINCKRNSAVNNWLWTIGCQAGDGICEQVFTWQTMTNGYRNTQYNIYVYYNH